MNKTAALSFSDYSVVLRYDPDTGRFFRLKDGPGGRKTGDEVQGTVNSTGYVVLNFFRRPALAHRIAWLLMTGDWPVNQIDHINRSRTDNRWANLRPATIAQNNANAVKTRPRQLPTGVKQHPRDKLFYATISVKNKDVHLGCFRCPEEAHSAYLVAKEKFHGPFSPYK